MKSEVRILELSPHPCRLGAAKQDLQSQIHAKEFGDVYIWAHRDCERAQWKITCGMSLVSLISSSSLSKKVAEGERTQFRMCPPIKSLSRTSTTR